MPEHPYLSACPSDTSVYRICIKVFTCCQNEELEKNKIREREGMNMWRKKEKLRRAG
jgi:hypothetical protein